MVYYRNLIVYRYYISTEVLMPTKKKTRTHTIHVHRWYRVGISCNGAQLKFEHYCCHFIASKHLFFPHRKQQKPWHRTENGEMKWLSLGNLISSRKIWKISRMCMDNGILVHFLYMKIKYLHSFKYVIIHYKIPFTTTQIHQRRERVKTPRFRTADFLRNGVL